MPDEIDIVLNAGRDALALTRCYMAGDIEAAAAVITSMTRDEIEGALVSASSMYATAIRLIAEKLGVTPERLLDNVNSGIGRAETVLRHPPGNQ